MGCEVPDQGNDGRPITAEFGDLASVRVPEMFPFRMPSGGIQLALDVFRLITRVGAMVEVMGQLSNQKIVSRMGQIHVAARSGFFTDLPCETIFHVSGDALARARDLREQGWSIKRIGKELGVAEATVQRRFSEDPRRQI